MALHRLMVNLGKHMLTTVPTPVSVATPGLSCLVKYPADEQWYRAEVISLQDDKHAKVNLLIQFMKLTKITFS